MIATVWLMLSGLMYSLQLQTGSFPKPLSAPEEQHYLELAAQGNRNAISYGCKWEMDSHERPAELCQGMIFTAKEQTVLDTYAKQYREYMLQARWQFIMGVRDPQDDEAWNNYLATLKANGEEPLLETYQSAYTRIYG